MALSPPIWMQNEAYPARLDRQIIASLWNEGVISRNGGDFLVTERGAGPTMSVDIAAGRGIVDGDDQADQGSYLIESTAVENVAVTAPHATLDRIDSVVAQIRDPNAGGAAGDDFLFVVVAGTPGASPVAPTLPDSALLLAYVLVSNGDTSVLDAAITDKRALAVPHATAPVGTIEMYGGATLPDGYLWATGADVSRTTYAALFAAYGTLHGAGDGSTTFGLPDLSDRFVMGDSGSTTIGDTGGAATVTLSTAQIPSHTHPATGTPVADHTHGFTVAELTLEGSSTGDSFVAGGAPGANLTDPGGAHTPAVSIANTGGGAAHENRPPFVVLGFIIKAF